MKILHCINSLAAGGAEKLVTELLPLIKKLGHEVEILILNNKNDSSGYAKILKNDHIKVYNLNKGFYNPISVLKIIKILRINNYDIVHGHLFPILYYVGLASFRNITPKFIYTEHNITNRRRDAFFLKRIDRIIYKRFNLIIVITTKVKENLKQHLNNNSQNFKLVPNGINLDVFSIPEPDEPFFDFITEKHKILVQVSSFTKQKDQKTLIKSLKLLPENVIVLLIGDGPLKEEHKRYVEENGLVDRVYFLGVRTDVPRLLRASDVVVLSSHYEGLSLSSIEGMASGKPFVASNVEGLSEVVEGAGVLFAENDHEQLAQKLTELLSSTDYYNEVKEKCLARAKAYDIHQVADSYLKAYEKVLSKKKQMLY